MADPKRAAAEARVVKAAMRWNAARRGVLDGKLIDFQSAIVKLEDACAALERLRAKGGKR